MVTKFLPLPDNGGGKKRSYAILRRLLEHGNVVLCAFADGSEDAAALRAMNVDVRTVPWRPRLLRSGRGAATTRSLTAGRFWDPALAALVRATAAEAAVDLLQIEYTQLARYGVGVPARRRVLDMHNIESSLMARHAVMAAGLRRVPYRLEQTALRRMERWVVDAYDLVLVVSETDRRRLLDRGGRTLVCPNGWDPGDGPLPPVGGTRLVFVGDLGWAPNVDAATWLVREVLPWVRRRQPAAEVMLVGRRPSATVRALAGEGVRVFADVPSVRPFLGKAAVALAPLRVGGGTRLKILEALDAGRPVVATSVGVEGLEDLVGRGVVLADEPRAFADAVADLLDDPDACRDFGRQGHAAVRERYSWDSTLGPLMQALS